MTIEVITKPVASPVTLQEVKAHLKVDDADAEENALVYAYINAAMEHAQNFLHRSLITQTLKLTLDCFKGRKIKLPNGSVQSVTYITTYDSLNASTVFDSSKYRVSTSNDEIILNDNESWPTDLRSFAAIEIIYVAGYGDNPGDIPENIRLAIMQTVGHFFENRESVMIGQGSTMMVPDTSEKLMYSERNFI